MVGSSLKSYVKFLGKIINLIITTLERKISFAFHMNLKLSPPSVQKFGMLLCKCLTISVSNICYGITKLISLIFFYSVLHKTDNKLSAAFIIVSSCT